VQSSCIIGRWSIPLTFWIALCYFAPLFILFVLPLPGALVGGVDEAWQAMLPALFLRHAAFGRDFVFTYGPWGFLQEARGYPAVYPWMVAGRLLLTVALSWGAALLIVRSVRSVVWAGLLAVVLGVTGSPFFILPLVATLMLAERTGNVASLAVVLAACALAAQAKFGVAILFAALLAVALAWGALQPRLLWTVPWAIACYLAFWLVARQSLGGLSAYWSNSFLIASSYSQAIWGSELEAVLMMAALGAASVVLAACCGWRRLRWWGVLWLTFYFFFAYKQVAVRQDRIHIWENGVRWMFPAALLVGIWILAAERRDGLSIRREGKPDLVLPWMSIWAVLCVAAGFSFLLSAQRSGGIPRNMIENVSRLRYLPAGPSRWENQFEDEKAELRKQEALMRVEGTVDLFPFEQAILMASGNDWRPRPIPQSYSTYSTVLAALNAQYFEGADAPEHVFFRIQSNVRVPSTEDSLAWLALLSRYEPVDFTGHYLHLRRAEQAVPLHRDLLLDRTIGFGETLEIPGLDNDLLWVEIGWRQTAVGRLLQFLYRSPGANAILDTSVGGQERDLIPDIVGSGFLLSPWVADTVSFAMLYGGPEVVATVPKVRSLLLLPNRIRKLAYGSRFPVRIYRLTPPVRPLQSPSAALRELAATEQVPAMVWSFPGLPEWQLEEGMARLNVRARSRGTVTLDHATGVHFRFGTGASCGEPVEFTARLEGSRDKVVMREHLCGQGEKEIRLPTAFSGKLILETNCGTRLGTEAYWSEVTPLR